MHKNKRATEWFWLISGIMAALILVITIFIVGKGTSSAESNLDAFQSCKGQKGECKSTCGSNEIGHFKALGCGSGEYSGKDYCCIKEV